MVNTDISYKDTIKTIGKDFLSQVLPEGQEILDTTWNDIFNAPDVAKNFEVLDKNGEFNEPSFMAGLSIGARFGMISVTNLFNDTIEQLSEQNIPQNFLDEVAQIPE